MNATSTGSAHPKLLTEQDTSKDPPLKSQPAIDSTPSASKTKLNKSVAAFFVKRSASAWFETHLSNFITHDWSKLKAETQDGPNEYLDYTERTIKIDTRLYERRREPDDTQRKSQANISNNFPSPAMDKP
ncbi:hypothetical protein CcaCcLH18_14384 [Colletotrichum camelliae]|nr:hypothetical protein CcaCcLH18_14384 [Colletotrichum camelliae]